MAAARRIRGSDAPLGSSFPTPLVLVELAAVARHSAAQPLSLFQTAQSSRPPVAARETGAMLAGSARMATSIDQVAQVVLRRALQAILAAPGEQLVEVAAALDSAMLAIRLAAREAMAAFPATRPAAVAATGVQTAQTVNSLSPSPGCCDFAPSKENFNGATDHIFGQRIYSINMLCIPSERNTRVDRLEEIDPNNWSSPKGRKLSP